jgi:asparaginyl-tRNA synthetase
MKRFDLGAEAEKLGVSQGEAEDMIIAQNTVHPFFLTNLKREAYDRRDDATGKFKNYDVLFPVVGEILSGGEREYTEERLTMRMNELGYNLDYFEPVLRVARDHGLKSSAGAGFGVERLTRAILLLPDIQSIYPFPRIPERPITM